MTVSLIMHKRIFTTLAKAKALRMYAEPLINCAKEDNTPNRRLVFSHLQNKYAVTELFREIAQKIADRNGGYTRILKTGNRLGDNAKTCFIELVDYNENMLKEKGAKKQGPHSPLSQEHCCSRSRSSHSTRCRGYCSSRGTRCRINIDNYIQLLISLIAVRNARRFSTPFYL